MFHTQQGHFINGKNIEEWQINPLNKGDLHCLVGIGASEHKVHYAPKSRCESILARIIAQIEEGFEHTLDFRGFDEEHLKTALKPDEPKRTTRSTSKTTSKAKTDGS